MEILIDGFLLAELSFSIPLAIFFGLGCFVAIGLIFVGWYLLNRKAKNRTMVDLARRLNGRAVGGGQFVLPDVVFQSQGYYFFVRVLERHKVMHLCLTAPWPVAQDRLSVSPELFWSKAKKLLGMQDLKIGVPHFDNVFVLQANSNNWLIDLMTPQLQQDLLGLLANRKDMSLTISGGECSLTLPLPKLKASLMQKEVNQFLNLRMRMLGNLAHSTEKLRLSTQAIELKVAKIVEKEATCMVCGNPVNEEKVQCRRCKTPHHHDCWEYFEGCSRYGCGEKFATPENS